MHIVVEGITMILKDKEIVKIFNHLYERYIDYKDININTVNFIIGDFIKVRINVNYYHVDTDINVIAKVNVTEENICITTKGIIKYGFVNLDFNKMAREYLKDKEYISMKEDTIYIKNEYIRSIQYGNSKVQIELK